jgi:antitoxin component HigA of HigAB toxin-antitoxin module
VSKAKPISTQADYEAALTRIEALMGATPDSPEEEELASLPDLVDAYEQTNTPPGTGDRADRATPMQPTELATGRKSA